MELKGHLMETLIKSFQQLSWILSVALTTATQLYLECWLENLTVHFSIDLPLARFHWLFLWHLKMTQVCLRLRIVYLIFFIQKITQSHTTGFFFSDVAAAFGLWTAKFCVASAASSNQGRTASEPRRSAKNKNLEFFDLLDIET